MVHTSIKHVPTYKHSNVQLEYQHNKTTHKQINPKKQNIETIKILNIKYLKIFSFC
jgi:hypothetical protein